VKSSSFLNFNFLCPKTLFRRLRFSRLLQNPYSTLPTAANAIIPPRMRLIAFYRSWQPSFKSNPLPLESFPPTTFVLCNFIVEQLTFVAHKLYPCFFVVGIPSSLLVIFSPLPPPIPKHKITPLSVLPELQNRLHCHSPFQCTVNVSFSPPSLAVENVHLAFLEESRQPGVGGVSPTHFGSNVCIRPPPFPPRFNFLVVKP